METASISPIFQISNCIARDGKILVPTQLTHAEGYRFANGSVDTRRNRMIYVVEDHNVSGEPQNLIGAVDLETGELTILAKGHDFYSSPVISPDGSRMAFMTWDHPNMPWDESTIWVTELDEAGMPGEMILVGRVESKESRKSLSNNRSFQQLESSFTSLMRVVTGICIGSSPDRAYVQEKLNLVVLTGCLECTTTSFSIQAKSSVATVRRTLINWPC
jgi:hypothetical protein